MPRELRPELEALIESGHCNWHTTVDLVLTGDVEVHLSSGEILVDRFGVNRQYLAKLRNIQPLDMSVAPEVDQIIFDAANVDMVMGQTLTGATRRLDGARAIVGTLFIDRDDSDFDAGQHICDPRMSGELVSGEVGEENVSFALISDVDVVIIAGRTIASEFQWREPVSVAPLFDPSDIPGHPGDGGDTEPGRRGRYGDGGLMPLQP